jgi:hypothetical protein
MAINSQVKRLVKIRSQQRSDPWPEPPLLPPEIVAKFPELRLFNEAMKLWSERVRNLTEPDTRDGGS